MHIVFGGAYVGYFIVVAIVVINVVVVADFQVSLIMLPKSNVWNVISCELERLDNSLLIASTKPIVHCKVLQIHYLINVLKLFSSYANVIIKHFFTNNTSTDFEMRHFFFSCLHNEIKIVISYQIVRVSCLYLQGSADRIKFYYDMAFK